MTNAPNSGAVTFWIAMAGASGVIATIGLVIALYGFWLTSMSFIVYHRDDRRREADLGIVLVWDVLFFTLLLALAVIQLWVAGNLVILGDHYGPELLPILNELNHLIAPAYIGYALSVLVSTLIAPGYILARFLTVAARRRRVAMERAAAPDAGKTAEVDTDG